MTEENYEYRTSQLMLRNSFRGDGKWEIPIIPKFQIHDGDFDDLLLLGFDRAKTDDEKHRDRMVHFFLYDYKFERVWKQPDLDIEKLSRYRAVSKFMQRFGHRDSIDFLLHGSSGLGYGIVHNT